VTALGGDAAGSISSLALARFLLGDWYAVVAACRDVVDRHGPEPPGFLRLVCSAAEFVVASRGGGDDLELLRGIELKAPMRIAFRALGLRAEGRAEEALELVSGWHRPAEGLSFLLMAEAQLLQTLGRWPELASYCADMRERAVRIGWEAGPAMADRLEAAAAVGLAAASAERFAAIGAEWEAAVSRLPLADALLSLGRHADAAAALAQAEAALRRAGAIADLERFAALSSRPPP